MDSDRSWTRFSKVCDLERTHLRPMLQITAPLADVSYVGSVCILGISQQYSFENRFTGRG
jgi:hypothetical protein